jgi:hypothetical protein
MGNLFDKLRTGLKNTRVVMKDDIILKNVNSTHYKSVPKRYNQLRFSIGESIDAAITCYYFPKKT